MKVTSAILLYFRLSLSFCALSLLQSTQISDKKRYLLNLLKLYNGCKNNEKVADKNHLHYKCLQGIPYAQWANKKIIYSSIRSDKQVQEANFLPNREERRKKINNLSWKIEPSEKAVDITHYIVKTYADFGTSQAQGTATIINIANDTVYLLTCAHNVVKYQYDIFKNKDARSWSHNVTFIYQGNHYETNVYYVHPSYKMNDGTDIAIIVFYGAGQLHFPYNFFPELTSQLKDKKHTGWVIGFPGEKEKNGELYGMSGTLEVMLPITMNAPHTKESQSGSLVQGMFDSVYNTIFSKKKEFVIYKDIVTSNGQSGSAIWVKVGSIHKIIGVHTNASEQYKCNYGPFLDHELITWIKRCYKKIKEINTAFLMAAEKGNLDSLKMLKNKGASVKTRNRYNNNALHLAALHTSNGQGVEWLIDIAQIPIESKGRKQKPPFLMAAEKGNVDTLKILKNKGADLKVIDQDGHNALHLAAMFAPNSKTIQWLIDTAHIPIESKTSYQKTPFLMAASTGNLVALKILKNKGANLKITDQDGDNALHYAVLYAPNAQGIQWLIDEAQIPIESKGSYQKTPFLMAAEEGNLSALKILKNKGAHLKVTDQYGDNALHYVAMYLKEEEQSIKWLIDAAKIPIESKGQYQKTPFLCAAEKNNLPALKLLKNKGANVDATDQDGNNALHQASLHAPNGKGIEWLIDTVHIPIESKGQHQKTPFLMAAQKGNLDALKILKNKDANVNATDQYGNNALHLAAMFAPNDKGIQWLIDTAHISIESKGQHQKTPFLMAAQKGNLDALKILKNKDANVNATDQYDNNALHLVARYAPNIQGIQWLIDTVHIPIESKGNAQATPFLMAAKKGNLTVLKMLKNKGAKVNATDKDGNNALHLALLYASNEKEIEWLIDTAKIPINSKGKDQKTPFLMVAKTGNLALLEMLKNKGAKVNATDKDGNNALHYAAGHALNDKSIQWLIDTAHIPIESKGEHQKTPFLIAAKTGNLAALKILRNKGAHLTVKDQNGNNALGYALEYRAKEDVIKWLINTAKVPIDLEEYDQTMTFLMAAKKGNLTTLKILKAKGAHLNTIDQYGNNALHLAAMFAPNGKGIQWLIDSANIPIESKGQYHNTPFLTAANSGNLDALKILKKKGAYLNVRDKNGNNSLHLAAMFAPNKQTIQWLIDIAHISIESKGFYQKTPFLMAAQKGNLDALKILKKKGAKVNATDQRGDNALHLAAMFAPNKQTIQWLIDIAHIPIESKGFYYKTPFLMAAEKGNLGALKILKNKGANLNVTDPNGNNALHLAALWATNGKGIEWLIDTLHIPIESKGQYHKTPFLMAAEKGNLEALKILKKKGAKVNVTGQYGYNALHLAALHAPNGQGIEWLIDTFHIPIESKGSLQGTPFLVAAKKGNLDALKILKKKGANVNATDQNSNNALHYAAGCAPNGKTIKWLIDTLHISIESKGYYQCTSFLIAAQKGNLSALKILKNKGANINSTDLNGNNALHLAALYAPNGKGIQWLIDTVHISIESKGPHQKTTFLMAAEKGNLKVLKILKKKGAKVNATDQYGHNALHYAAMFAPNGQGIKWLVDAASIPIESKEQYQKTPFLCAAGKGNLAALKILKNKGANLNAIDKYGDNALHYAAIYAPNGQGIEWLINEAKIPIESKGDYKKTPFLSAANKGNLVALKILKNKGANIYAKSKYGSNALWFAKKYSNSQATINWLQEVCELK